jgi:hypothetical protein
MIRRQESRIAKKGPWISPGPKSKGGTIRPPADYKKPEYIRPQMADYVKK